MARKEEEWIISNYKSKLDLIQPYAKAISWIKANTIGTGGIAVSDKTQIIYPEVTGYLIPTLLRCGEISLAEQYGAWLLKNMPGQGVFTDYAGESHLFDSMQILRGFNALYVRSQNPELKKAISKISNQFMSRSNGGAICPMSQMERLYVFIYCLYPLSEAGAILGDPNMTRRAAQLLQGFVSVSDQIYSQETFSHFLGYIIGGLYELGAVEIANKLYEQELFRIDRVCNLPDKMYNRTISVTLAQLAKTGYLLGHYKRADQLLNKLVSLQEPNGGFRGSFGDNKQFDYFNDEEISWTVKFFLDAIHEKQNAIFRNWIQPKEMIGDAEIFVRTRKEIGIGTTGRLLDVGCGSGRLFKELRETGFEYYGIDITMEAFEGIGNNVKLAIGNILDLPCADNEFDIVTCTEVLEHAMRTDIAIKELFRVTKPGGKVIIIDKSIDRAKLFNILPTEQWFSELDLKTEMLKYCDTVTSTKFTMFNIQGLMIMWIGKKKGGRE
jgi:malonyl-CoA O-methyltransferase